MPTHLPTHPVRIAARIGLLAGLVVAPILAPCQDAAADARDAKPLPALPAGQDAKTTSLAAPKSPPLQAEEHEWTVGAKETTPQTGGKIQKPRIPPRPRLEDVDPQTASLAQRKIDQPVRRSTRSARRRASSAEERQRRACASTTIATPARMTAMAARSGHVTCSSANMAPSPTATTGLT